MALYRQEDLDDQFVAEAKKTHDEQLAAIEKCIRDSSLKTACPPPDELGKKRDAKKLLASLMLLGMMAEGLTGEQYTEACQ